MDKLAATFRAPFFTLPLCLLLVACVEEDYRPGGGSQGGGSSGDAPANPADCALGTWEIVMESSPAGDCFLPGSWTFETTYTVTGGNGSYTVVDDYGNPVSLDVAFPIGAECHAEFIQEQDRLITVMTLDSDNANIVGQGTFYGDNGCVTEFTASGTRW